MEAETYKAINNRSIPVHPNVDESRKISKGGVKIFRHAVHAYIDNKHKTPDDSWNTGDTT
jgi:hypothetical protein